jgi:hypothetical protein
MKWVYILVLAIVIALSILASLPFSAGRSDSEIYTPFRVSIVATAVLPEEGLVTWQPSRPRTVLSAITGTGAQQSPLFSATAGHSRHVHDA